MHLKRFRRLLTRFGFWGLIKTVFFRSVGGRLAERYPRRAIKEIRNFLDETEPRRQIVFYSTLDWAFPFDQRVHHLAKALADRGWKVVFVSPGTGYDHFLFVDRPQEGILVTFDLDTVIAATKSPTLYTISADNRLSRTMFDGITKKDGIIVYDFLDAIDEKISNAPLTRERLDLHTEALLNTEAVIVISTADEIQRETNRFRQKNTWHITNGVNSSHFKRPRDNVNISERFRRIIASRKPIIGYYGALASWFDFALIQELARSRPDYNIVLIGPDYDGSIRDYNLEKANIHVFDPVPYDILPNYGVWFDVAIIPFMINEITAATSPLKLFEYMALGVPIVSTNIAEAANYESVFVADDAQQFLKQIDRALQASKDPQYQSVLSREALENDWSSKASMLEEAIDQRKLV